MQDTYMQSERLFQTFEWPLNALCFPTDRHLRTSRACMRIRSAKLGCVVFKDKKKDPCVRFRGSCRPLVSWRNFVCLFVCFLWVISMFVFVVRSSSAWTLRCCVAVIGMSGCCVPQDMQKQCNNFDCIGSWSKCTCLGGRRGQTTSFIYIICCILKYF